MKQIQLILFGVGNVGSTLIDQVIAQRDTCLQQGIELNFLVILNSRRLLYVTDLLSPDWRKDFESKSTRYDFDDILRCIRQIKTQNMIAIDATASDEVVQHYETLIRAGCHIVSANKIANTLSYDFYKQLRKTLDIHHKQFEYETNVGAGLPVLETIKRLHQSGDRITRVRGVFSGSLSYLFNRFSTEEMLFSDLVREAKANGYTEPDPRDDLSGKDVGRKLLILARELQLEKEFSEIKINSLIPPQLNGSSTLSQFDTRLNELDEFFTAKKSEKANDYVLRYVGELDINRELLSVSLIQEDASSAIGQLRGADNVVEIYSTDYHDQPLVIKGAGAGGSVTARGVFTDILKVAKSL